MFSEVSVAIKTLKWLCSYCQSDAKKFIPFNHTVQSVMVHLSFCYNTATWSIGIDGSQECLLLNYVQTTPQLMLDLESIQISKPQGFQSVHSSCCTPYLLLCATPM